MRIAEIFHSIQGEGRYIGTPSVFVRTSGCNLRCWFCDTPYTSWHPEGDMLSVDQVVNEVTRFQCEHVVLTGGEPLLVPEMVELTNRLHAQGHFLTIETAGTVDLSVQADLMSISPKLANSTPTGDPWAARHDQRRDAPDVIERLIRDYPYQLKFVIDQPHDISEVEQWLTRFPCVQPENVFLMPQATTSDTLLHKSAWVEQAALSRNWKFSSRLHVEMYGARRGV